MPGREPLYIVLVSVHGLVRGRDLELGRDADTGGQVKYVVELARALAADPAVERVDLLTRRVEDPRVDADYATPVEELAPGARIVRLEAGPRRYLRKEVLWPHLDSFVDSALQHFREVGRVPDIIHTHYADAGYVGVQLAGSLGTPLVHTGHSLGRVKRERLREKGLSEKSIEEQFNITRRIEAEETVLDVARFVVASTGQEVEEQYALYENYTPDRMVVIPPGVDLDRFHPPGRGRPRSRIQQEVDRFLKEPARPMILAMSRPDSRKNLAGLLRAYGEDEALRAQANLVIVAGNRDDIGEMETNPRKVLTELLLLIDKYDLYGKVAYPKRHDPDDGPRLYRMAAKRRGIFVNPALTEPFGLTLLEAAASGLPLVATRDGGPVEILERCRNGVLVDPLDLPAMSRAMYEALADRTRWKRWSARGLTGVRRHYSWKGHVANYLRAIRRRVGGARRSSLVRGFRNRLVTSDRFLISDIDYTLLGDDAALRKLVRSLRERQGGIGFGVATGRNLQSAVAVLEKKKVPLPDVFITSVGSEIHYGPGLAEDRSWARHLDYRWKPDKVRIVLAEIPGLEIQPEANQGRHKISYYIDPAVAPDVGRIARDLRRHRLHVNLIFSHGQFLDVLPVHASKGRAVRYLTLKWGLPMERMITVGDSGNDLEMLAGNSLSVVVGNYSPELEELRGEPGVYFAQGHYANGIIEGLDHYGFFGEFEPPDRNGATT